ncbi:MAG: response regulator [Candidatus Sigynarchaeota archaeon]
MNEPVSEFGIRVLSPEFKATLGSEEAEIMEAIYLGFGDLESIHFITGIPVPCIERKVGALIAMGLVTASQDAYQLGKAVVKPIPTLLEKDRHLKKSATPVIASKQEKRVLVVDDEPDIRLIIRMVLEKQGYVVLEASNGQNALDLLDSLGPNAVACVITDYLMPHMNGLQLCDELRKHRDLQITIFLITAYLDKARFEATRCFDEKFMKPLDFEELVSRLSMHVA